MEMNNIVDVEKLNKIIRRLLLLSKDNISSKKYNKHEMIKEFQKIIEEEVSYDEN